MTYIDRLFRVVEPDSTREDPSDPRPLREFFTEDAVVVLGDPGAGKTTSFRHAAEEERNAKYVTARDLCVLSVDRLQGKTLYIDGLDEYRAGSGRALAALDEIRGQLDRLGRPRFRLSCRAADWFGDLDTDALRSISTNRIVRVLQLEQLTDEDILAICSDLVPDGEAFLREADSRGLTDLLRNPLNLELFAKVFGSDSWPNSRTELFNSACGELVMESNETHRRSRVSPEGKDDLLRAAGLLCAIQLCSGINGFSLDDLAADDEYPLLSDLDLGSGPWREVLGTRLFQTADTDRVAPIHRAVTEYLGARHLCDCIDGGLPLRRALALLSGPTGRVPTPLKGLFGQLATMLPAAQAEALIRRDALAVVLHGDAAALPPSVQLVLIESLGGVADIDPRSLETPDRNPFSGLASEDTEPLMSTVLNDPVATDGLVRCVLHSIMGSPPRQALGDSLVAFAGDVNRYSYLRARSVQAFAHCCPGRLEDLRSVLVALDPSATRDEWEIRGDLLDILYPDVVGPGEVFQYLVEDAPNLISSYTLFLGFRLVERTSDCDLPDLLDAATNHQWTSSRFSGIRVRQPRLSLLASIPRAGSSVSTERLYRWLGLGIDEYGGSLAGREEAEALRTWFEDHPGLVRDLFRFWLDSFPRSTSATDIHSETYGFWTRLQNPPITGAFSRWLLAMAVAEENDNGAAFLFESAVRSRTFHGRDDAPPMEEFEDFVADHERFSLLWNEEKEKQPLNSRDEDVQSEEERPQAGAVRQAIISELEKELDGIRSGTAINPLIHLAKIYFGLFLELDHEAKPLDRLIAWSNSEIANAALTGFVAVLNNPPNLPSAIAIGQKAAERRHFPIGLPIQAGLGLVFEISPEDILKLSSKVLQSAIALAYTNPTGRGTKWIDAVAQTRPDVVAESLAALWRPQMKAGSEELDGLHHIRSGGPVASAVSTLVIEILREYPGCPLEILSVFLSTAIRYGDLATLSELVGETLSSRSRVTCPSRTLWYAAGLIMQPEVYAKKFTRFVGKDAAKIGQALTFISPGWANDSPVPEFLKIETITTLILAAGPVFPPSEELVVDNGGFGAVERRIDSTNQVHGLITKLEENTSREATDALSSLGLNSSLDHWSPRLARAAAHQHKIRTETEFCYPPAMDVNRALSGGPPANPADLHALTADCLRDLGEELRHGSTDGYKALWNTDSHGRPQKDPRVENDCRDRVLERLRPMLAPHKVNADREGDYAEHKRADIKVSSESMNLPVEIKRHNHKDLWTAPKEQLQELYAQDPGAGGWGIYLVLWFGSDWKPVKKPPKGIPRPTTAQGLDDALRQAVGPKAANRIDVIVFDCSRTPADSNDRSAA